MSCTRFEAWFLSNSIHTHWFSSQFTGWQWTLKFSVFKENIISLRAQGRVKLINEYWLEKKWERVYLNFYLTAWFVRCVTWRSPRSRGAVKFGSLGQRTTRTRKLSIKRKTIWKLSNHKTTTATCMWNRNSETQHLILLIISPCSRLCA